MIRMRVLPAVLIGVSLMALTACGGDETPAASAPAATTATTAAAPAATSEAAPPADGPAPDDKKLCTDAAAAAKKMTAELVKIMQASQGEMPTADMKKILAGLGADLNKVAAASNTEVGTAIKDFAAKSTEASNAADPVTATDNEAYEHSGKDITAACKTAGVKVNF